MARLAHALLAALLCATPSLAAENAAGVSGETSAAAKSHLSADPRVNRARALIHRGRFAAALDILRPLSDPARADITDIRFLIGLSAIAAAKEAHDKSRRAALLNEAIAALRAILIHRPHLTRVRLELARAFFLKGDDAGSRRHFERVLAGDPPPAMAIHIRRFLHSIRARRKWSSYLSLNLERNDNINTGTETETIYIFGLPFVVNAQSRPRAQTGLAVSTGFAYQFPLSDRSGLSRLSRLSEHWRWRSGVDATRIEYEDREFDQTYLRLHSGPRRLLSQSGEISLQGHSGRRWLAGDRYSTDAGLRLGARQRLTRRLGVNGQVSWEKTRYWRNRQPDDTDVGCTLGATWLFSPLLQGSLEIGFSRERLKGGSGSRNHSRNATAGLSIILPKGWTLGGRLERERRRHDRTAPLSTERRVDRKRIARLFVLNRGLTIYGFSPQLIVARERQKSNSPLDNYRRTRADLRFVRQF